MRNVRPGHNLRPPRRKSAATPALAAGFLVVFAVLTAVFASDVREFVTSLDENELAVSEDSAPASTATDGVPELANSSTYIEGDVGMPDTLNPLLATSSGERSVANLLFRSIAITDNAGDPIPDLASSWEVSDDGTTYTVVMDPNNLWHDGEPVTVDDVLFTIALVRDAEFPGDPELSRFWRAVLPRQTGENSIQFTLLEPYVGFGNYLQLPILPKHKLGDVMPADLEEFDLEIPGSGPYRLDEFDRDAREMRLSRADQSEAGFEEIILRFFDSHDDAVSAFQEGEIHGVSYVPLDLVAEDSAFPGDAQIYGPELAGYTALYLNLRHPHFRDLNTRRAVEAAIDRNELVETVLDGQAIPGTSPIPRMSSAHSPGPHQVYDPDTARELLDQDGWELENGDEIRQRDGEYFMIPLIVNSDDPQRIAVANLIQEQLGEVGISVDAQPMPSEEIEQALSTRQFTAVVFGWRSENGNLDCFQLWHSSQGEDGLNFTGFSHSNADEFLLSARRAGSLHERNDQYERFQEVFAEQVPAVVLFYPRYHFAVSENVEGAEPVPLVTPGDRIRQISNWTLREH